MGLGLEKRVGFSQEMEWNKSLSIGEGWGRKMIMPFGIKLPIVCKHVIDYACGVCTFDNV